MKRFIAIAASALFLIPFCMAAPKEGSWKLSSPDGNLVATVSFDSGEGIAWSIERCGSSIMGRSHVSLDLADGTVYGGPASKLVSAKRKSVDRVLHSKFYRKADIKDSYNQLELVFKDFILTYRAFDNGVAYRFSTLSKKDFIVKGETAEFSFPSESMSFIPYARKSEDIFFTSFESTYVHGKLSEWQDDRIAFLPLMVEGPDGLKINISEADLVDYPGMYLRPQEGTGTLCGLFAPLGDEWHQGGHNMLQRIVDTRKDYIAECGPGHRFPWRVVAVASDTAMADNDIVYCLAQEASPEDDFSWVKPGKVAWDWWNDWNIRGVDFKAGINDATYKHYIDFASANGIEYVILDEGWAVNLQADLFQVVPEIHLKKLVSYAASKNVGIILWAGYYAFARDMEGVCSHYSDMGVKGFKVDFMDSDDQFMVRFHREAAAIAAKYKLMLDFHGTFKPSGLSREYPNVVNYEGVHGLEQMKWSSPDVDQMEYDVTIPYIRMFAGSMDYTQGAMRNGAKGCYRPIHSEPMSQGTRCHQLAEYVVFESPLNMLCDSPSNYMDNPECTKFIADIPVTWDETRVLDGKVGEYIVTARRKGDTWYVGGLTDWNARTISVDGRFIPYGTYEVEIFCDGVNADRCGSDYARQTVTVSSSQLVQEFSLAPGGGFAVKLTKIQ